MNEDCMNKLNKIAEKRAKENDASAKEDEGDNGDKDAIEKIRIEIASRVKTKKKLKQIFTLYATYGRYTGARPTCVRLGLPCCGISPSPRVPEQLQTVSSTHGILPM